MRDDVNVIYIDNKKKRIKLINIPDNPQTIESMLMATSKEEVDIVQFEVKICQKRYVVLVDGSAPETLDTRSAVAPMYGYTFCNNLIIARPCSEGITDVLVKDGRRIIKRYVGGLLIMD